MATFRQWAHGLLGTVIGGAANSVGIIIVDPTDFNLSTGWRKLASFAAISAIISAALFLKQSPLPGDGNISISPREWDKENK